MAKRWRSVLVSILLVGMQCLAHEAAADDAQYLGVFVGSIRAEPYFNEGLPATYGQAGFEEVANAIGTRGTSKRRPALFFTMNYFRQSIDFGVGDAVWSSLPRLLNQPFSFTVGGDYRSSAMKQALESILAASLATDMPVIIRLDGKEWWELRPDLWNWWNESEAGYNPDNINNVERFDWGAGPETAVKIGWRNWGSQMRVPPAPNMASPTYRAAQKRCLDLLLPVIAEWYQGLPGDKKYLFGGLMVGWELNVYWNNYYYANGNDYLAQSPASDPTSGPRKALGYAAARALGLQPGGGALTQATQDAICSDYLDFLIGLAVEHGIPRNLIITHSLGKGGEVSGRAAVTGVEGVIPGWSWYGLSKGLASSPLSQLDGVIDYANGGPWSLSETGSGISYSGSDTIGVYKTNRRLAEPQEREGSGAEVARLRQTTG